MAGSGNLGVAYQRFEAQCGAHGHGRRWATCPGLQGQIPVQGEGYLPKVSPPVWTLCSVKLLRSPGVNVVPTSAERLGMPTHFPAVMILLDREPLLYVVHVISKHVVAKDIIADLGVSTLRGLDRLAGTDALMRVSPTSLRYLESRETKSMSFVIFSPSEFLILICGRGLKSEIERSHADGIPFVQVFCTFLSGHMTFLRNPHTSSVYTALAISHGVSSLSGLVASSSNSSR